MLSISQCIAYFLVGALEHLDYFPFHIWDNPSRWLSYFSRWLLHHQPDMITIYEPWIYHFINHILARWLKTTNHQWEFQDPKMEVLYHIRPYFVGISPYIGLIYGRYLQFRFLKFPLKPVSLNSCCFFLRFFHICNGQIQVDWQGETYSLSRGDEATLQAPATWATWGGDLDPG